METNITTSDYRSTHGARAWSKCPGAGTMVPSPRTPNHHSFCPSTVLPGTRGQTFHSHRLPFHRQTTTLHVSAMVSIVRSTTDGQRSTVKFHRIPENVTAEGQ